MKTKLANQKSPATKYSAIYVASSPINLPLEKINLYKWVTEMSYEDYVSYSDAHKALGSFFQRQLFYTDNVENIGNETLVQRYEIKNHSIHDVQFYSENSVAYILRWFLVIVVVPWEMQVRSTSDNTSELICLIGADFSNWFLKLVAWLNGLGGFFLYLVPE